ncbi:MAG: conserved membrane protein of unknown function [Promethearchaeota archaeon]|jgi:hypothetical protein|nr:MAG: conserved membrane protein of unknown function [Candidatus Lokiarchaeota archaeon]
MNVNISDLTSLQIFNGFFTLIFVLISFIIGLRILLKYFSLKKKVYITVGLTLIFLSSPWWGRSLSFFSILLFGYAFDPPLYVFLMNFFVAFIIVSWIYSFADLIYPDSKNKIFIPYFIISVVYEVVFIILFLLDYEFIGQYEGSYFDFSRKPFTLIFALFVLGSALITGFIFAKKSVSSEKPVTRWRGRFLLLAILIFTASVALDLFVFDPNYRFIIRIFLIISSICYYLGFFLPENIANRLSK